MKNRIKDKLRSQTGASITYALLIFLVCAVVGSAVLVAGTTAAGRMSKVAENDQRYYAVTSAARLLIDLIDDQTATIVEKDIEGTTPPKSYYYLDSNGEEKPINGGNSIPVLAAYQLMSNPGTANTLTLSTGKEELNVVITCSIEADKTKPQYGEMKIGISKTTGTSPKERTYSMRLVFNLDNSKVEDEIKDAEGKTTKITTSTYTWHLRDIQVLGSGVARE